MQIENEIYITKEKNNIKNFLQLLVEEINLMNEIYVVDRIENNIVVCENRDTRKMRILFVNELPQGIKEGTVLKYIKGKYIIDKEEQEKIEDRIKEKMNSIWDEE